MGPKAKKKKQKELSKAERLKLLQEEEERRLKEEEEARLKLEKEELERLEIQRIESEKWHQLEEKDLQRRGDELQELYMLEDCFSRTQRLKRDNRALAQWLHYTKCDGSPDPTVCQELNTFISLWEEERNETFEEVLGKSKLVLSLIEKLQLTLLETPSCELEDRRVLQYQESILKLQEILHLKFSVATELLLRQASTLADLDSGNMEKIIQDENVTLYVWANLKKNPRYRSIKFSETQVGFEIPRVLAMSDIALRLLHTRYDHVTPRYRYPAGAPSRRVSTAEEEKLADSASTEEVAPQEEQPQEAEQESGLSAEAEGPSDEEKACVIAEEPEIFTKEECEAIKSELETRLLREAVSAAQLSQVENALEKPDITVESEVDLCQYSVLGGVYHLDLLQLPPQCKPVKGWVMLEILNEGLQTFKYPPDTTEETDSENAFPPIAVTLEVHENLLFCEDPMIARWDAKGKHWRNDGIRNVLYNREQRLITFSLETLGPVTLLQDAHLHMPYLSWELRPLDRKTVLLTVTTVFMDVHIHVKENACMLASVELHNQERLSNLEGEWMAPVPFITALKNAGVNIFPTKYSHYYVMSNNKVPVVEMKVYRQMALLSSAFAFGWSKWNSVCDSTKVIFKVKEQPTEETEDPPWALLMFSGDRAQVLKINEDSAVFSEALQEETEFHSTLYHMVQDSASKEAMDRVRNSACQFTDSVCHMLLSTRVLSYS